MQRSEATREHSLPREKEQTCPHDQFPRLRSATASRALSKSESQKGGMGPLPKSTTRRSRRRTEESRCSASSSTEPQSPNEDSSGPDFRLNRELLSRLSPQEEQLVQAHFIRRSLQLYVKRFGRRRTDKPLPNNPANLYHLGEDERRAMAKLGGDANCKNPNTHRWTSEEAYHAGVKSASQMTRTATGRFSKKRED